MDDPENMWARAADPDKAVLAIGAGPMGSGIAVKAWGKVPVVCKSTPGFIVTPGRSTWLSW